MDSLTKLLADLVAIPSMNPMGRGGEGEEYREQQIADFVASYLRSHGVDVEIQEIAPNRPNVIGLIDVGAAETLLLEAHLDTVRADNMSIEPFDPIVREGRLFGRGACDTKGSLAAFLHTAVSAIQSQQRLRFNLLIAAVCDEEYRFGGANALAARGLKASFGIVGEPTQLRIIRAHKGVTRWKIRTKGLAAHSAYPQRGKNAIFTMAEILGRLERYGAELLIQESHPLLGTPSLSVGVIEGGEAVNVIPDQCWVEIDRRSLPDETKEEILDGVRSVIRDVHDWEFEEPYLSVPGMEVSEQAPIVRMLSVAVQEVLGNVMIESASYATDAGVYNTAGVPTVVFGPGDIAQAHTANEYIKLDELRKAVQILHTLIRK